MNSWKRIAHSSTREEGFWKWLGRDKKREEYWRAKLAMGMRTSTLLVKVLRVLLPIATRVFAASLGHPIPEGLGMETPFGLVFSLPIEA